MEEVTNKKIKNATANAANAAQAQAQASNGVDNGKGKGNGNGKVCHRCQRPGHLKAACFATKSKSGEELAPNGVVQPPPRPKTNANANANARQANESSEQNNSNLNGQVWKAVAMEALSVLNLPPGSWIVDSGASHHMSPDRTLFSTMQDYSTYVTLANGKAIKATGIGKVEVCFEGKTLALTNVLFVPELDGNLLLIGAASKHGITVEFGLTNVAFKHNGSVIATAKQHGSVYVIELTNGKAAFKAQVSKKPTRSLAAPATAEGGAPTLGLAPELVGAVPEEVGGPSKAPAVEEVLGPNTPDFPTFSKKLQSDYWKWHRRFGHAGASRLQRLQSCVEGITLDLHPSETEKACSTCLQSKMIRVQAREAPPRATKRLQRVYSDMWGLYRHKSLGGNRYFVTFTDEFSRYSELFLMGKKTDVYNIFSVWKLKAEKETDKKVSTIRSDNGGEYGKLSRIWAPEGVEFEFTTYYTPEQNGISERLNRTITESIRGMLLDAKLPVRFWGEAAKTACYLCNRLPLG